MKKTFKALGAEISSCQKQVTDMLNAFSDSRLTDQSIKNMTKQLSVSLNSIQQKLNNIQTIHIDVSSSSGTNLNRLLVQLEHTLQNFTTHSSQLQDTIHTTAKAAEDLAGATAKVTASSKKSAQSIKVETNALKSSVEQSKNAKTSANSLAAATNLLTNTLSPITNYFAKLTGIGSLITLFKNMTAAVTTLDSSFAKIRLSTDSSRSSLESFRQNSFALGKSIGISAENVQQSALIFTNLGYSLNQTGSLVKNASLFAHAGNMNEDQAAQHMLKAMDTWNSEFQDELAASQAVIDRYTNVAKAYGTATGYLADTAEQSAGSFKRSGNNLNETLGLIAVSSQLGQNVGTAATALQTLSLRLRDAKAELSGMGYNVDDLILSSGNLRSEIQELTGVDVMIDDTSYKSTARIIQEIGSVYQGLDHSAQDTLLKKLVGDGDTSALENLLLNYRELSTAIETAENSEGTALAGNAQYLDTIAGKAQQAQVQFQELASTVMPEDFLKGIIDSLTELLSVITKLVDTFPPVVTLLGTLTSIGGISFAKNFGRPPEGPRLNFA